MENYKKPARTETRVVFQARLSYCHLDKPWAGAEDNTPKYSVSAIVPKEDAATVEALKQAYQQALTEGTAKVFKGVAPNVNSSNFKKPIKDGDMERPDDPAYKGSYFISCNSAKPVPCLDRSKQVIDPVRIYSGCYGLVSVTFFAYDKGSKGVAAGLNAVLFLKDGEKLGGGNAEHDFDQFDLDDDIADLDNM